MNLLRERAQKLDRLKEISDTFRDARLMFADDKEFTTINLRGLRKLFARELLKCEEAFDIGEIDTALAHLGFCDGLRYHARIADVQLDGPAKQWGEDMDYLIDALSGALELLEAV